jgi:hypothetical protein
MVPARIPSPLAQRLRTWRIGAAALACLQASAALAQSQPDDDLARIPSESPSPAPTGPSRLHRTIYLESATQTGLLRSALDVRIPPPAPATIEQRLFADARIEWTPLNGFSLTYSGRPELRAAEHIPFPTHENLRLDSRELFASWRPVEGVFLDVGRINLKNGVALGFNPTDFFRTRAVVEPLSVDPSVLREDRLGALMVRGQFVWNGGAISAAYAPKLTSTSQLYQNTTLPSVDPMFDRTNAHHRLLVKGNVDLAADFSPELLLYDEDGQFRLGLNIARSFGKKVVAYAEWAGGNESSLAQEALSYGVLTGSFPASAASALMTNPAAHFQQDLSAGLSYATESRMTFWAEYHLHQAGFSRQDWQSWFADGTARPTLAPLLWYVRGYAQEQQVPLSKHALFLRADWTDAFVLNFEMTAFANVNLYDGSTLAQLTASYAATNLWTIALLGSANLGTRRSEFGSLPAALYGLLVFKRYF